MLRQYNVIGIAGTHGKTTTTALIAYSLKEAGLDPSYIVGGILGNYDTNAGSGKGSLFVIEADEYARTFHAIFPSIAVVTTVEHDHPDCYPTAGEFHQAFQKYVDQTSDTVVICQDDPGAIQLQVQASRVIRYGFDSQAEWRAENARTITPSKTAFDVFHDKAFSGTLESSLHGEHNIRNILAAWSVCDVLGVAFDEFRINLSAYRGVRRRFEILGVAEGITVIDDYAHHPTEIRATLAAAKSAFPEHAIWAIFQPHTYSRLREFFTGFAHAFDRADAVLVTEVFAAREDAEDKVSGRKLASEINHNHVLYAPSFAEAVGYLRKNVTSPAVVITLSAGDGNEIGRMLLQELEDLREGSDVEH
jgi:UDP-N-acetylmuramate--alanine ligase